MSESPVLAEIEQQLNARDLAMIEAALGQLVAHVERDRDALLAWRIPVVDDDEDDDDEDEDDDEEDDEEDDDDDDAEGDEDGVVHAGQLPVLDLALDRHLAAISPRLLARLFAVLFRDRADNFHAARRIAYELVSRGDGPGIDEAQCELVGHVVAATSNRGRGPVYDAIARHVFPLLRPTAVIQLQAAGLEEQPVEAR